MENYNTVCYTCLKNKHICTKVISVVSRCAGRIFSHLQPRGKRLETKQVVAVLLFLSVALRSVGSSA